MGASDGGYVLIVRHAPRQGRLLLEVASVERIAGDDAAPVVGIHALCHVPSDREPVHVAVLVAEQDSARWAEAGLFHGDVIAVHGDLEAIELARAGGLRVIVSRAHELFVALPESAAHQEARR